MFTVGRGCGVHVAKKPMNQIRGMNVARPKINPLCKRPHQTHKSHLQVKKRQPRASYIIPAYQKFTIAKVPYTES